MIAFETNLQGNVEIGSGGKGGAEERSAREEADKERDDETAHDQPFKTGETKGYRAATAIRSWPHSRLQAD